jgi:hypothetical protein
VSGSCAPVDCTERHATTICCGIEMKMPPLKNGAVWTTCAF